MPVETSTSLYVLVSLLILLSMALAGVAIQQAFCSSVLEYVITDLKECVELSYDLNLSIGYKAPEVGVNYVIRLEGNKVEVKYEIPYFGLKTLVAKLKTPVSSFLTVKPGDFIVIKRKGGVVSVGR